MVILLGVAAAKLQHQLGGKLEPRHHEVGIDAALEPEPRVGLDAELAAGARRALGIEIGRLDEHIGGGVGDAGILAADHPAKTEHFRVVGDHAHIGVDLVALAVEREEFFALASKPARIAPLSLSAS